MYRKPCSKKVARLLLLVLMLVCYMKDGPVPQSLVLSSHLYIFCVINMFPFLRLCTVFGLELLSILSNVLLAMISFCLSFIKLFYVSPKQQNQLALCFCVKTESSQFDVCGHLNVNGGQIVLKVQLMEILCCSPNSNTLFLSHVIIY